MCRKFSKPVLSVRTMALWRKMSAKPKYKRHRDGRPSLPALPDSLWNKRMGWTGLHLNTKMETRWLEQSPERDISYFQIPSCRIKAISSMSFSHQLSTTRQVIYCRLLFSHNTTVRRVQNQASTSKAAKKKHVAKTTNCKKWKKREAHTW